MSKDFVLTADSETNPTPPSSTEVEELLDDWMRTLSNTCEICTHSLCVDIRTRFIQDMKTELAKSRIEGAVEQLQKSKLYYGRPRYGGVDKRINKLNKQLAQLTKEDK